MRVGKRGKVRSPRGTQIFRLAQAALKFLGLETREATQMYLYSFLHIADDKDVPIGNCENDAMAVALLGKEVGGIFSLQGSGDPEYLMKKSSDGWGNPTIPVYRRK